MGSFKPSTSLITPIEDYLRYLQHQRRISDSSLINYRSDLTLFCGFIADYRLLSWADISCVQAQAFLNDVQFPTLSKATIARRYSSLRGFFDFLRRQSLLDIDPLVGYESVQKTSHTPAMVDIDHQQLLDYSAENFIARRDKAILTIVLNCKITLPQLLQLDLFSVDLANSQLHISQRGIANSSFELPSGSLATLQEWLSERVAIVTYDQGLFISQRGRRLSLRAVQLVINKVGRLRGISALTAKMLQRDFLFRQEDALHANKIVVPVNSRNDDSRSASLLATYQQLSLKADKHD
ncbi:MAG: site-specific integrase [Oceanospirillaceae bacterium]|nr:site-specific integrase [Oceanospirillaceae bacterium]